uniref:Reverse transcriptase domain-containing protein n=1 Tax=Sinocyclocheilus grahami TaxID=75366 RepID=A0A672MJB1_SINGR
ERKKTRNLTISEERALTQLRRNKKIVIKPADKGNAVVLMNREDYLWEGMRQLSNTEHYSPLTEPIYPQTQKEVGEILEEMYENRIISGKQKEYLLGLGSPRARRFYLLPKIHKNSKSWSIPDRVPPGRPIVSDCNSETYNIAEFIEFYLSPISQKHASYLKDTYDFIQKTKDLKIPSDALLFTIDVDSLYTNIETPAGLEAVRGCMLKYPDDRRPDEYILKLLEINLTKNDFEFNSKYFLQTKGTAMGKKFAPSYANIFMACWEETAADRVFGGV